MLVIQLTGLLSIQETIYVNLLCVPFWKGEGAVGVPCILKPGTMKMTNWQSDQ